MAMDERKQRVLRAIVSLYSVEGEPVGNMAVSSATLRNEMAALTRLGLLEQPHTSAGRVPSAKGYRYYIDHLLDDSQPLDRVTRARVDSVFASLDHEPDRLAQGAVKALAQMSGYTAAVSTPCADDLCIAHFEVVQVGRNAAAILAVTSAGYVRTRVARVRDGLTREKAAELALLLNRNLTFVAAMDLSRRALAELCSHCPAGLPRGRALPAQLAAAGRQGPDHPHPAQRRGGRRPADRRPCRRGQRPAGRGPRPPHPGAVGGQLPLSGGRRAVRVGGPGGAHPDALQQGDPPAGSLRRRTGRGDGRQTKRRTTGRALSRQAVI